MFKVYKQKGRIVITENIFKILSSIDVSQKVKEKNKMPYLPWSSAWEYMLSADPNATYDVVHNESGCIYHTDGKTCWVETTITAGGKTQSESLAVMDNRNRAIPLADITTTDTNKAVKRCLVKNCALFGLGLNLWYGEELSDNARREKIKKFSELDTLRAKAVVLCKTLTSSGLDSKKLAEMLEERYGCGNPNKISDIEVLNNMIKHLEDMGDLNNE